MSDNYHVSRDAEEVQFYFLTTSIMNRFRMAIGENGEKILSLSVK